VENVMAKHTANNSSVDATKAEPFVDQLFEIWKPVRQDTVAGLGKDTAYRMVHLHSNNWIDMSTWVSEAYTTSERMNMVFAEFQRVFKEIYWTQFLFLNANYPAVYRSLRYMLEMMAQAYRVDEKFQHLTIDGKMKAIINMEDNGTKREYGWQVVKEALISVFQINEMEINNRFKPTWASLNRHSHPSARQLDKVVDLDPKSLITDSFDETLAGETLVTVDVIMDLVDAIVFTAFPQIKKAARRRGVIGKWEKYLPNTVAIMRAGG
jgi:hypothetical protein